MIDVWLWRILGACLLLLCGKAAYEGHELVAIVLLVCGCIAVTAAQEGVPDVDE